MEQKNGASLYHSSMALSQTNLHFTATYLIVNKCILVSSYITGPKVIQKSLSWREAISNLPSPGCQLSIEVLGVPCLSTPQRLMQSFNTSAQQRAHFLTADEIRGEANCSHRVQTVRQRWKLSTGLWAPDVVPWWFSLAGHFSNTSLSSCRQEGFCNIKNPNKQTNLKINSCSPNQ